MNKTLSRQLIIALALASSTTPVLGQTATAPASTYQPKYSGDPAHSDSEAAAIGYMRVVLGAQKKFNKQYGHFATSLGELVHSGNFTKRMVNSERGDYTVGFKGKKDSFMLTMTPKQLDSDHRSFYADDENKIHVDDAKAAGLESPLLK